MNNRAFRLQPFQRDGHRMPRAADHLREGIVGDRQRGLPGSIGRDQQPSREPLAMRVNAVAGGRNRQIEYPLADVGQRDAPNVFADVECAE